nr:MULTISPECIES: hypothetical protein [unclassified Methanosarcina]
MIICPKPLMGEKERPFVDRKEFIKAFETAFTKKHSHFISGHLKLVKRCSGHNTQMLQ